MKVNENFVSDVFNKAGSLGDVPIIIIGDYHIRTETSQLLANLITSGQWMDTGQTVATVEGRSPEATQESRGVSSRIDLAFGNTELMSLLKGMRYWRSRTTRSSHTNPSRSLSTSNVRAPLRGSPEK